MKKSHIQAGFTLIELMIVIAIISIIAAIALPNYNQYLRESKLVEAQQLLSDYRVKLEQYYQDNRTYANAGGTNCGVLPTNGKYFTVTTDLCATANAYTLTATGTGPVAGYVYTLNQGNTRQTTAYTNYPGAGGLPAGCWLVKGTEC
jgi:type IV pilus assembly protein PilE